MPIKGLTDRQAQFPEIGRIRKGAPKTEEGYVGKDLDYFRVEFDETEVDAYTIFINAYGQEPDQLNILLPFNSVDENFEAWREAYIAGGMTHRCDGEKILYDVNADKLIADCDGSSGCKPVGRLKVLIPELKRLAFLTVLTGSIHDIMNISRQLDALLKINGRLAGVPLILKRKPVPISTPSGPDGKRARRVKSLLSIEANPTWVAAKLDEMQIAALPTVENLPLLEAPEIIEGEVEVIPGEDLDDPPPPDPEDEPVVITNGDRPYPAAVAREKIEGLFDHDLFKGRKKTEKRGETLTLQQVIVINLNKCFEGNPDPDKDRHSVLAYISRGESASIKDPFWTGAKLCAIEKWLEVKEWEGHGAGYAPRKESRLEAVSMVVERMKEQGQQELPV